MPGVNLPKQLTMHKGGEKESESRRDKVEMSVRGLFVTEG